VSDITIPLIPGRGTAVIELDGGETVRVAGHLEGTVRFEERVSAVHAGRIMLPSLREQVVTVSVTLRLGPDDQLAYQHHAATLRRPRAEETA